MIGLPIHSLVDRVIAALAAFSVALIINVPYDKAVLFFVVLQSFTCAAKWVSASSLFAYDFKPKYSVSGLAAILTTLIS